MTQAAIARGRARTLRVRPLKLTLPEDTPRYWFGGDPFSTHLLNALSLTFPGGERMFMYAVRAHRDRLTDPVLREQVKGFLSQEAMHSREHGALNAWLDGLGYPAKEIEQWVTDELVRRGQRRDPKIDLVITCALEHLTAIMAEAWLESPALREGCDPHVEALWTWHALEELDHKAVAFDIYTATHDDYVLRVTYMVLMTLSLIVGISMHQWQLMDHDGQTRNLRSWARGLWTFWGPRGHFTGLARSYLRYFRRDFHPWDQDDTELIARGEAQLAALLEKASARRPRQALGATG